MRGKVCTIDRRWNQVGDFMQFSSMEGFVPNYPGGGGGVELFYGLEKSCGG
jgi:hypothetical protein